MGGSLVTGVHVKHVHAAVQGCTTKGVAVFVGTSPSREDVDHLILTRHWRHPRLRDPAEHAADSASGTSRGLVGGTEPCLAEAGAVELTIVAGDRPDVRPFVVVHQGVHMAVAIVGHSPTLLRAVVAIVADALASVEVGTDGIGAGATAHATVLLGDVLISVVHQGVADVVDVHIVGFTTVVAIAGTFVGADADTLVDPSEAFGHIALIVQHLVDVRLHILHGLNRETASEELQIVIVAFQLAKPVVGTTAAHRVGREVGIVTNEQDELKVVVWVVVDILDVILDLGVVVATDFAQADDGGGTPRLVLPVDKGLHGFHVLVGADDQQFAAVFEEGVLRVAFLEVNETVVVS